MQVFDVIKCVYEKRKPASDFKYDDFSCIMLNRGLGFDKNNINIVKKACDYLFFIEPKHYFILLYLMIPKVYRAPFNKWSKKDKAVKEKKVYDKLKYVLGWSQRELERQKPILDKVILTNEKYWKQQLGV